MQATAWGPGDVQVYGCRGYRERHVFRVASTPQYQFQRAYSWHSRPVKVRAISEELVQRVHEENIQLNGAHLLDLPPCRREESRAATISVHGGERGGRPRVEDSLTTPIVQTATFTFRWMQPVVQYSFGPSYHFSETASLPVWWPAACLPIWQEHRGADCIPRGQVRLI